MMDGVRQVLLYLSCDGGKLRAFAYGMALDLFGCGVGSAVCGVCGIHEEVLSFA